MQQYLGPVEDTVKMTKERLDADTTNGTLNKELKVKEKNIESLKVEFAKAKKELEIKLVEKDAYLDELKGALSDAQSSEAHAMTLYSESKKKLQELEAEMEKLKVSEKRMFDSFAAQTKQLEQTIMLLEESKPEVNSLREKLKKLESRELNASQISLEYTNETIEFLKSELQMAKEKLASSQETEKSLLEEVSFLKNELQVVTGAEENNQKALDDFALALKEVALQATQASEKLASTEAELEESKSEAQELKLKLKNFEDSYKVQLDELKKEAELYKNTAERLRMEAEESFLAWSEKETRFVDCIRRAEEERDAAQQEHGEMVELLKEAENATREAKDETLKLRDILKQAINESNVAKEASGIAREENARLQDALHAKEEALNFICRENEDLKMNEAANNESIKELKKLVSELSSKVSKLEDTQQGKILMPENSLDKENKNGNGKKLFESFSMNVKDVKTPNKPSVADENVHKDSNEDTKLWNKHKHEGEDSVKADPLRGLKFGASSPGLIIPDDLEPDSDRSTRKKKALIRRFGDILMMRRTPHKMEPSME